MTRSTRQQAGGALVFVLLRILIVVASGALIVLAVNRNTDLRFAFHRNIVRNIVGLHSAEAGIHVVAGGVENAMLKFNLPTNCSTSGTRLTINGRTVTYKLSVPTGPPWNGVAGSCAETPLSITEGQGTVFSGLNALLYTYNVTSAATNALGFTEASINNQFQAQLIPMFQFAAFYANDLELAPGPNMVINGRLHTNKDMYLNDGTCGAPPTSGLSILGQLTTVGSGLPGTAPLNRGFKVDTTLNSNDVYISLDGTHSNTQVLGTNAPGSTSCANANTRQIGSAETKSFNRLGPRVVTGLQNIALPSLPGPTGLMCVPWIAGCGSTGGRYWQSASFRLALDTTTTKALDSSGCPGSGSAPCLYPIEVLNADGTVNTPLTNQLTNFMQANPGAITYSDVPSTGNSNWNCTSVATCETVAYNNGADYTTAFPRPGPKCAVTRHPRDQITAANFCNDYRYGGFFNWRERKPILMLNIDWMALEEYNHDHANVFFDPNTTTNGGLIIFLTVKDTTTTEGLAATNYGVRIYDAGRARRNLTDPGVAFATDQAMYIAGNFNCPQPTWTGSIASPAPCGDSVWPPTGPSTYQKPTSLSADTLNVLSCAWIQARACGSFSMNADQWAGVGVYRPLDEDSTTCSGSSRGCAAQATIINAAFYSNVDPTWCPSNSNGTNCGYPRYYSGGVENYPRFHEDWSGTDASTNRPRNFWYQGSLVASGAPAHTCFEFHAQLVAIADDPHYTCTATAMQGFWSTQRDSPPPRRWFYDASFNDAVYLPPLTPRFVYLSLVFFTQVFQ